MPRFESPEDRARQEEARGWLATHFECDVVSQEPLSEIDYVATRNGRALWVGEHKARFVQSTTYPTVFLSWRKWMALVVTGHNMECGGLYVVRFYDRVLFVTMNKVDARGWRYFDTRHVYRTASDHELVVEVPVSDMTELHVF